MRILLTGHEGFIGRNFLKRYGEKYDIDCFEGDLLEKNQNYWFAALYEYDCVVHLAALAGVRKSHEIPQEFWQANVEASKRLFDAAAAHTPSVNVVYASSSSIYEWWLSPYAATKKAMETVAGPKNLGLRFHTVYGKDSRPDMLYDKLLRKDVKYLTDHSRDWTHVEDVCDAIDICIQNFDLIDLPAIDVGNGQPVLVTELAEHLWPDNNLPVKEVTGERINTCADPAVLSQLGWVPKRFVLDE